MEQLTKLILSLNQFIPSANVGHLLEIINGIYSISSGGVTGLNISRYCSISYRTIQRFMATEISWNKLLISMLGTFLSDYKGQYLIAIDETVEDKAGKSTHKLGYFFSSKLGKAIKSVSFGVLSLVAVDKKKSYVLDFEQMAQDKTKTAAHKAAKKAKVDEKKQKAQAKLEGKEIEKKVAGRKKGSTNKNKTKVDSESYRVLSLLLTRVLPLLKGILIFPLYLVGDGAYGNISGCLIAAENNLFLISKLHYNTALFYPPKPGTRQRKYGDRIDFLKLDEHKIKQEEDEDGILTYFQIKKVQTRTISQQINVVILRYEDKTSKKVSFALLFSTDLSLDGKLLAHYYSLRFQIEFNFRDAKQYFGLSDFKNIKEKQVKNAVGLSFFMVNLSAILIDGIKEQYNIDVMSILDLKACFRAIFFSNRLKNTPILDVTNILKEENTLLLRSLGIVNMTKNSDLIQLRA